jgi:hypothetical protein
MPTLNPQIVVLTVEQLEAICTKAAKRALDMHAGGDELKLRDAAKLLRRGVNDLYVAVNDGTLPARKAGKAWMIDRRNLMAWDRATPRGKG